MKQKLETLIHIDLPLTTTISKIATQKIVGSVGHYPEICMVDKKEAIVCLMEFWILVDAVSNA